jgi:hypothetical protein
MAHDSGPGASMLLRFRHKRRHPARMIDMTMGVDRGVKAVRRKLPHHCDRLVLIEESAGIDQNQTFFGFDRDNVGEPSVEHNPGRDFLEFAGGYQRMLGSDSQVSVPELLGLFPD